MIWLLLALIMQLPVMGQQAIRDNVIEIEKKIIVGSDTLTIQMRYDKDRDTLESVRLETYVPVIRRTWNLDKTKRLYFLKKGLRSLEVPDTVRVKKMWRRLPKDLVFPFPACIDTTEAKRLLRKDLKLLRLMADIKIKVSVIDTMLKGQNWVEIRKIWRLSW